MTIEVKTIAQVIEEHKDNPEGTNGGGILATCTCGTPYDWMPDHLQDMILRDCFPHLAQLHQELITSPSGWLTKQYYKAKTTAYEALEEDLYDAVQKDVYKKPVGLLLLERSGTEGYERAMAEIQSILDKHDV